jgi:F-type H+-transporting ATPase subunit b
LLRGPIGTYFRNRESNYKQALSRAEAARASAEQRRREVQDRLAQLEATAEQALATARTDAEGLRVKLLADAEESARTLREEAHKTAEREISRAKAELREELLSQAVALSANLLKDKMAETDQKRLQTEFVDKIQVVR